MGNERIQVGENDNLILYSEVAGLCPTCSKPLIYEKGKKKYKRYEVAHIYPLNPKPQEKILLQHEEMLSLDVNDPKNLILLCGDCHTLFDKPRTVEEYRQLVAIKKEMMKQVAQQNMWHQYLLEEDISKVIRSLNDGDDIDEKCQFSFDPKVVDDKVDTTINAMTLRKIKINVNDYYGFVKRRFVDLDMENPGVFDKIAAQIKLYYVELKRKQTTQEEVYKNIVIWLHHRTGKISVDACDVIASFFVQNCEVFE